MKHLSSEKGNTLLIAIFVLTIAAVIGLSLMTMSLNGIKRNETREDMNQATEQAEKGITHLSKLIQKQLDQLTPAPEIGTNGSSLKSKFYSGLTDALKKYYCSNNPNDHLTYSDGNLKYTACLEDLKPEQLANTNDSIQLTLRSTGTADGKEQTIESTFELKTEVTNYPQFLRYAVSTHGEGNLILNGGIDIKGNVLADGNIIVSKNGYVPVIDREGSIFNLNLAFNANPWKETVYPNIEGKDGKSSIVKVNTNKNLFDMNTFKFHGGCTRPSKLNNFFKNLNLQIPVYITYYDLTNYDFNTLSDTSKCLFNISETTNLSKYLVSKNKPAFEQTTKQNSVDIKKIINEGRTKLKYSVDKISYKNKIGLLNYSYTATEPTLVNVGLANSLTKKRVVLNGSFKIDPLVAPTVSEFDFYGDYYFLKRLILDNHLLHANDNSDNLLKGKFYFEPTILDTLDINGGQQTLDGDFYLERGGEGRDFFSDLEKIDTVFDNALTINNGEHTIKGIYYIDGDVQIKNATINADAILYVDGDVQLERSVINSLNGGKLIIFATGNIIYEYASELGANIGKKYYNAKPVELHAYLYSDKKIELHGTLSNIHVKGGVTGKQVLLSGVRGEVENKGLPEFKNAKDVNAESRLKIEYDENVINQIQELYKQYESEIPYHELAVQPLQQVSREIK